MRKSNLISYKLSAAQSLAASFVSVATNIEYQDNVGYQFNVLSGSPTGALSVEISVDYNQDTNGNITNAGHWVQLFQPDGTTPVQISLAAGLPASSYIDMTQLSAPWIRFRYTRTSGSGSLDAFITAKMV